MFSKHFPHNYFLYSVHMTKFSFEKKWIIKYKCIDCKLFPSNTFNFIWKKGKIVINVYHFSWIVELILPTLQRMDIFIKTKSRRMNKNLALWLLSLPLCMVACCHTSNFTQNNRHRSTDGRIALCNRVPLHIYPYWSNKLTLNTLV